LDLTAFFFGQRSDEERSFHTLYHTTLSIIFREFALENFLPECTPDNRRSAWDR
jgi:hypothetical protein